MAQGNYSKNQAPVSGPGPFSARTDKGPGQPIRALPNAGYGETKDFEQIQSGAQMAAAPQGPSVVPLHAPTQRPNEPVTAGASMGPGAGREALGIPSPAEERLNDLGKLAQYLPLMEMYAGTPMSSGTMKSFVKYLRSQTG